MPRTTSESLTQKLRATKLIQCALHGSLRDLKSLVRNQADLHTVDDNGASLLHYAVANPVTDVLEYLLEAGLPVESQDNKARTPLLACCVRGRVENMWVLIAHGANIRARDRQGSTAIHYAAFRENPADMLACLVGEGADIDEKNTGGATAFHACAHHGNIRSMMSLVREGANFLEPKADGITALHIAVLDPTSRTIEYLLSLGMPIDIRDNGEGTPLHACALRGNLTNTRFLVEAGADIQAVCSDGLTALHYAVMNDGTSEIIEYLLRKGVPVGSRDESGNTPLHTCALLGNLNNLKALLKEEQDLECTNELGQTALHRAAANRDSAGILAYLLNKGSSMYALDEQGNAAIHLCASHGTKINMQVLLRKGCDIETKNAEGQTPLFCAIRNEDAEQMIDFLLSQGAAINTQDKHGIPLLHYFVDGGTLDIVKMLIERGANVRVQDRTGKTAIHHAVTNANAATIVKFFLNLGLSINARDKFGITPIQYCARNATLQSIRTLVDMGASIDERSDMGLTALHFAALNEETSAFIEFLLSKGMPLEAEDVRGLTALHHSIMVGNLRNMKLLVDKGASVEARASDGMTALHLAAIHGDTTEALQYLIQAGASIDSKDRAGRTPLLACALEGNSQKIKLLVERGADILKLDENGLSALHYAAGNKKTTDIIQYLLDEDMPLESRDKLGRTPMLFAAVNGNLRSVKFLCERGADPKSVDKNKMTALHFAASNDEGGPIIEYLIAKGLPVDVKDNMGFSPLLVSKGCGVAENERILIENGAKREELDARLTEPANVLALERAMMYL